MQSLQSQQIVFLGEQDGAVERELKSVLTACLAADGEITAAYLVRVSLTETPGISVALCLYPDTKSREALLQCVSTLFRSRFNATQHLDILFLKNTQKLEIDQVAKPFFYRELCQFFPAQIEKS